MSQLRFKNVNNLRNVYNNTISFSLRFIETSRFWLFVFFFLQIYEIIKQFSELFLYL